MGGRGEAGLEKENDRASLSVDRRPVIIYRKYTMSGAAREIMPFPCFSAGGLCRESILEATDMKVNKRNPATDPAAADDTELFASMCKALGHPARLMIINYLQQIDQCLCGDIVELLPLAQSTVSQHLKCLRNAGLIRGEVEGPRTCYCLNRKMLERFTLMVADLGRSGNP